MPDDGRMTHTDLLADVRATLEKRVGELRQIAQESGIAYDTVLRIKNREGDPGYSKVQALAKHLQLAPKRKQKAQG